MAVLFDSVGLHLRHTGMHARQMQSLQNPQLYQNTLPQTGQTHLPVGQDGRGLNHGHDGDF